MELREKRFDRVEGAGARELLDDGDISVAVVVKSGMEFSGVEEDLEGEIEVFLAKDHGNEAFWIEVLWPRFNRRRDGVVF